MAYYESDKVKVFPTVRRNDEIDRKARLNTEENIVSLSNRISGNQSYIFSGLNISEDGKTLSSGICVIKGYYFKIENAIRFTSDIIGDSNYLYFKIKLEERTQENKITFTELARTIGTEEKLDDESFFGLEIVFSQNIIDETSEDFVLLVAKKVNDKWKNDNISSRVISNSNYIMDDGEIPSPEENEE